MADLSITTTQVIATTTNRGTHILHGTAGEAITQGQSVYLKSTDNKLYKADADDSAATAAAVGIAVSAAGVANQQVSYQKSGTIVIGAAASITAGETYFVSDTAGGIKPAADLGAGDYVTYLGVGDASNGIVMPDAGPVASGTAHA